MDASLENFMAAVLVLTMFSIGCSILYNIFKK